MILYFAKGFLDDKGEKLPPAYLIIRSAYDAKVVSKITNEVAKKTVVCNTPYIARTSIKEGFYDEFMRKILSYFE